MRGIALAATAVMLASSASVVGLDHENIPMPRRRRIQGKPISLDTLHEGVVYGDEIETRAEAAKAELAAHQRKIDAAKAKRARKAAKAKEIAERVAAKTTTF